MPKVEPTPPSAYLEACICPLKKICQSPTKLYIRIGCQLPNAPRGRSVHRTSDSLVNLVLDNAKRQKRTQIEKTFHGKSESISSTSLLVRTGAPGPKVTAGNPETGSITIFAFAWFFLLCGKVLRRFGIACFLLEALLRIRNDLSISKMVLIS